MQTNRPTFLQTAALAAAAPRLTLADPTNPHPVLEEFSYHNITLAPDTLPELQFRRTQAILQSLNEDALLKPFRVRAGIAATGPDLGGWYDYVDPADTTANRASGRGFRPGSTFGQWLSSFARTEALGDLGGVNLAYRAYHRSREGKGPEPVVDGFTPDQQFFLAEAQWRGAISRPEAARVAVASDPHPPGKYRVLGPLSNMPEFQKAFSCKAGDPMVRDEAERCALW